MHQPLLSRTSFIVLTVLLGGLLGYSYLLFSIDHNKWTLVDEAQREFARMPDVQVLSERYTEEFLTIKELRVQLDVRGKGQLVVDLNYSGGFQDSQQFFVRRIGSCDTQIELRAPVRYAIEHYEDLQQQYCPRH